MPARDGPFGGRTSEYADQESAGDAARRAAWRRLGAGAVRFRARVEARQTLPSTLDAWAMLDSIDDGGVGLGDHPPELNTTTAAGRLMSSILAAAEAGLSSATP